MKKWYFARAKNIGINGFNNIGGSFLDSPIKSLAKEICQNSLDTKMSKYYNPEWNKTIRVEFNEYNIRSEELDGYDEISKVIQEEYDFAERYYLNDKTVTKFYKNALEILESKEITCLRISDFNTPGLTESDKPNSAWSNLVKNIGVSDKPNGSGGSKGQGKLAAYACSSLYTVFYNTNSVDSHKASAGVARLSGYELSDNYQTIGAGFYENDGNPISDGLQLLKNFSRSDDEYGTDVIIVGFKNNFDHWEDQIIASVIDNFFVSIINEDLEVKINDGKYILNSNTLENYIKDERISKYLNGLTKKYYEVLTADEDQIICAQYTLFEENDLELIIKVDDVDDGLLNTVATIRLTGMKILDLDHLPKLGIYHGVLFMRGKKVNDYFRKLENDTHDKWSPDRADNITEAEEKIERLKKFVRDTIKEKLQVSMLKEIDAEGVGEILPDEDLFDDSSKNNENESLENKKIKSIQITEKLPHINKKELLDEKDENGENNDIELDDNGNIALKTKSQLSSENPSDESLFPEFLDQYSEVSRIVIPKKLKVIGEEKGYQILFATDSNEPIVKIRIFIYGESNNEQPIIKKLKISKRGFLKGNIRYKYKENEIEILGISGKDEYLIELELDTDDIWPLEVKVYGNK